MITSIVKPMATLILSRKLYLIASRLSVELPNKAQVSIMLYCALTSQLTSVCCRGTERSP